MALARRNPEPPARVPVNARPISYGSYLSLEQRSEEKLEFVDGWVYAMSGGTPTHARLAARVLRALGNQLEGTPCEPYSADLKIHIAPARRSTFADVTVVCGEPKVSDVDENAITNPAVLIEVLSPTTTEEDRGGKWRDYQRLATLKHYVLVSQDSRRVEVYSRDGLRWRYEDISDAGTVALPKVRASLELGALYDGIVAPTKAAARAPSATKKRSPQSRKKRRMRSSKTTD